MNEKRLGNSYYYIGKTNMPCIFCISSCFPIIDKYIERPYTINGIHLILKYSKQSSEIRKKLISILKAEQILPNRFEQKITNIKKDLIEELKNINNQ